MTLEGFYQGDGLQLSRIETVETASWLGAGASDHKPLVATFRALGVVSR
jgi:endonuclease/exonuclease/phosphatase (EEP) superfamily protein YafD